MPVLRCTSDGNVNTDALLTVKQVLECHALAPCHPPQPCQLACRPLTAGGVMHMAVTGQAAPQSWDSWLESSCAWPTRVRAMSSPVPPGSTVIQTLSGSQSVADMVTRAGRAAAGFRAKAI